MKGNDKIDMLNLYQFLINCYPFWSGHNNRKFYKAKTKKITFFQFWLTAWKYFSKLTLWNESTKPKTTIGYCVWSCILLNFLHMDFSDFPNPRCYDRYSQFIWVETNPKIQIAKNPSCIQYGNRLLLPHTRFFLSWGNLTD